VGDDAVKVARIVLLAHLAAGFVWSQAAVFRPLQVSPAGTIVNDLGNPVRLRGLNRSGTGSGNADANAADADYAAQNQLLSMNVVRIFVNTAWWSANVQVPIAGVGYQSYIDTLIQRAKKYGNYVLIVKAGQFPDAPCGAGGVNCPAPNQGDLNCQANPAVCPAQDTSGTYTLPALTFWNSFVQKYAADPAILYDTWEDMRNLDPNTWSDNENQLIATIRTYSPNSLIFVEDTGTAFESIVSGVTPDLAWSNLVWNFHIYNGPAGGCANPVSPRYANWPQNFDPLVTYAQQNGHAAAITEWGGCNDTEPYHSNITTYAEAHAVALVYFDSSNLITSSGGSFQLTPTGAKVAQAYVALGCNSALNLGGQAFGATGGTGSVNITATAGCAWSVSGAPVWVVSISALSGAGNGTVNYQVTANPGADRSATLTLVGLSFTIEQEGGAVAGLSPVGSMPHLAAEENWTTAFTLVNKSGVSTTERLSLFGDDNSYSSDPNGSGPLTLPLAFPQQLTASGPLLATSFDRTLAANASLIVDSAGVQTPPVLIGSAQLAATGAVDGFAIFHQIVTTQEAVVPLETRNARSYLLPFDNTNNLVLGVALANISAQSVTVQVVIRDDTGAQIATGSLPQLAAGDHFQFGLATQFPITANKRGTIEFDTPQNGQISVLGLRFTPPNNALTTIPALANVGAGGGSFAHLASGGDGWQTTFVLVNVGPSAAQATLSFFADQTGAPLPLPLSFPQPGGGANTTASFVTRTLAAGATLVVVSNGAPQLLTGSAQLTTAGQVSGFEIFRHNNQEAVVPLESRNASAYILAFDNTSSTATGIAINAVSAQPVNIPVTVRDDTGASIANDTITLAANGHTQFTLVTDRYQATANIRGTIEFDKPAGAQIGALGIRIPPGAAHTYTTLPALAK
jgi:hypothetical protein